VKSPVQRFWFGCVVAAVVGVHVSGTPVHADPIGPAAHNGVTVWTGTDSTDFDVWHIRSLIGSLGAATLTTSDGVVVTAVQPGVSGQGITVTIVDPGAPNAPLSITVVGNEIVVSLATGLSSTPTSTAAHVAAALNASPAASALVSASTGGGPGADLVGVMSQTALSPVVTGHADLTMLYQSSFGAATLITSDGVVLTAVQPGVGGHGVTVTIVDPGGPNAPLMITVVGNEIVVSLATGPLGTPTSTAAHVAAALNASPAASALVSASTGGGPGADLVGVMSQTALSPVVVEAGSYADFYETVFSNSPTHPRDALIAYLGGPSVPTGALFLYVKDGGQEPAFYVYDLLAPSYAWNGVDDLVLNGFWAPTGSITSLKIFGSPAAVPEPFSITLLGMGLAARAWSRRRGAGA